MSRFRKIGAESALARRIPIFIVVEIVEAEEAAVRAALSSDAPAQKAAREVGRDSRFDRIMALLSVHLLQCNIDFCRIDRRRTSRRVPTRLGALSGLRSGETGDGTKADRLSDPCSRGCSTGEVGELNMIAVRGTTTSVHPPRGLVEHFLGAERLAADTHVARGVVCKHDALRWGCERSHPLSPEPDCKKMSMMATSHPLVLDPSHDSASASVPAQSTI